MLKYIVITTFLYAVSFKTVAQKTMPSYPLKNTYLVLKSDSHETIIEKAIHIVPTANQYSAMKNEYIAFVHFGPNTFTGKEWGNGMEDPKVFDLKNLDTDQWCRVMKEAGMKMVIFTAKHHDGFVMWQSRYTKHGIMSTNFKNGNGDVLKELSASCKKYGLKLGIYLSPADLYQIESPSGLYGNLSKYTERTIPRPIAGRPFANKTTFKFKVDDYNEYFMNQLFELLTEYGTIDEVWFDGATPKSKGGQKYNYQAWKKLIHTLAPKAVIYGKEDLRWCGNEAGKTRNTEWNVISYPYNPDTANYFPDLTDEDLGSRKQLYKAKYLHYQPAETNTSIREGWFYRDDSLQNVRSADDIVDMYERAVGGNSIFLLNIPPNTDGKFSTRDVDALLKSGSTIKETYAKNLFQNAKGSQAVLDNDALSYFSVNEKDGNIIIETPEPVTINRIELQEAVTTHGERVEKHAVDAFINGQWQEIANATNIGYKRILRFPEITSNKFRVRILESRATPAISTVAAFYYKTRPPQLQITTTPDGLINIAPKLTNFNWKLNGENASANINKGIEIRYTIDGTEPTTTSNLYEKPFPSTKGIIKAAAFSRTEKGPTVLEQMGIPKKNWKLIAVSSEEKNKPATFAFDGDVKTFWNSKPTGANQSITIDLGDIYPLSAFSYTPPSNTSKGLLEKGTLYGSEDGKKWTKISDVEFGNLVNDPTKRRYAFNKALNARYIRLQSTGIAANGNMFSIAELDFFEE